MGESEFIGVVVLIFVVAFFLARLLFAA